MSLIIKKIKEFPDIALRELIDDSCLSLSESALSKSLKQLSYTYKKRHYILLHSKEKISYLHVIIAKTINAEALIFQISTSLTKVDLIVN